MTFEWKWKRTAKRSSTLILYQDGKKIGSVAMKSERSMADDSLWDDVYVAYKGGGRIGAFHTMTEAKIAVETALGVSTMKSKKKPEPERI